MLTEHGNFGLLMNVGHCMNMACFTWLLDGLFVYWLKGEPWGISLDLCVYGMPAMDECITEFLEYVFYVCLCTLIVMTWFGM